MELKNNLKIFPNFYNQKPGVWYFIPFDVEKYENNMPTNGFGCIKYGEGSVYYGDIFFDGKRFNKLGNGKQEFYNSSIGNIDPTINERMGIYVGKYNYRKGDWIYGNGVLYYCDKDNKPTHFVKGFFKGVDKIKDYEGTFDYSELLDGYDKSMEFDYSPRKSLFYRELEMAKKLDRIDNIVLGDSYIEFWNYKEYTNELFYDVFKKNTLNVGLGGTTFCDWLYYGKLLDNNLNPKVIVVDLGFNDVHSGSTTKEIISDFKEFNAILNSKFPKAKKYYILPVHSPAFLDSYFDEEEILISEMKKLAKKENINLLDAFNLFEDLRKKCKPDEYDKYFYKDGVHLNDITYKIYKDLVKDKLV